MTDRQGKPGSYLLSRPDTRGSRSSTHGPCFTSPFAKFDGSHVASSGTDLVEHPQAISWKHEIHYNPACLRWTHFLQTGRWPMQYLRSSTEAVVGSSRGA